MNDAKSNAYACPRCVVGRCRPQSKTFAEVYQGQLLCIPNMPAFVCDVCQFVEFEPEGLESLWKELYGEHPMDDSPSTLHQRRFSSYGD